VAEESNAEQAGQTQPSIPAEQSIANNDPSAALEGQAEPTERPVRKDDESRLRLVRWWRRPTVRAIKREAAKHHDYMDKWDRKGNVRSRLPDKESVHLGGLVLAEAFSPSTVSALYDFLRNWPGNNDRRPAEWVADLDRSRSGARSGWSYLGVVRPSGEFMIGDGYHDDDLPDSVTAVWFHLSYLMPSLAVVVATFTFSDNAADCIRHSSPRLPDANA
jgi:hypothetical protein